MRYLIVDDNENIRKIIRQTLCENGDKVIESSDGNNILTTYKEFRPDFVLMDIQMPGNDGLQVTKEIKKKFPEANIIILTNYDTQSFRMAAIDAGAAAFVSKDNLFEIKKFINKISLKNNPG